MAARARSAAWRGRAVRAASIWTSMASPTFTSARRASRPCPGRSVATAPRSLQAPAQGGRPDLARLPYTYVRVCSAVVYFVLFLHVPRVCGVGWSGRRCAMCCARAHVVRCTFMQHFTRKTLRWWLRPVRTAGRCCARSICGAHGKVRATKGDLAILSRPRRLLEGAAAPIRDTESDSCGVCVY